jgi:hypothetical protein
MKENDPDRFDSYPPKRELWEKWFDPVLFPFGWTPGGSGCLYLIHIENGRIWRFNPDGGLGGCEYQSVNELLERATKFHKGTDRSES